MSYSKFQEDEQTPIFKFTVDIIVVEKNFQGDFENESILILEKSSIFKKKLLRCQSGEILTLWKDCQKMEVSYLNRYTTVLHKVATTRNTDNFVETISIAFKNNQPRSQTQPRTREQRTIRDRGGGRAGLFQGGVFTVHGHVSQGIGFGIGYNPGRAGVIGKRAA